MYLRETRRRNRDGSEVAYLALAHNERDRDTGVPKAQIIHNFGRADRVDREGLARLVKSISRFLDPADAVAAAADGEVVILDSRPMGTAWVADQLWQRLGIGAQIIEVVGRRRGPGRRVDAAVVERVIFAMAANREGIPVRVWTFPGNTSDQVLIRTVKDDLRDWNLNRVIWALDRGFTSAANRRYLQRAGGHYIMGEKLRGDSKEAAAALSRQGRYQVVAGNLRVKEVRVDDGAARDRFVICHNPDAAIRDAAVRDQIVARLAERITGSDALSARKRAELAGQLKTKPAFARFLRATPGGLLRLDRAAVRADAGFDGKFLLRTSDESLTAADIAQGYKGLYEAERGWRDLKSTIDLRPVYHRREDRIRAHVQLHWLALLLLRVAETTVGDTWRNIRDELQRMHLVTLATRDGHVAQRSELTPGQRSILRALELPEPPRFFDFTPADQ